MTSIQALSLLFLANLLCHGTCEENVTLAVETATDASNQNPTNSTLLDIQPEGSNQLATLNASFEGIVEQFSSLNLTEADTLPILNGFQEFFLIVWNLFSNGFSVQDVNATEYQSNDTLENSTSLYLTTLQGFGDKISSLKDALGTLESERASTNSPIFGSLSMINGTNSSESDVA